MPAKKPSHELHLTRLYDAPVKMVWDAWTDPKQAAQWWGPRGFTITTHKKDLRVGGTWNYTMHGPDGVDYPNITVYHEVEPLKRLVYDHGANETQPPLFRVTVCFTDVKGKTKMDMTMAFSSPEAAAEAKVFIKKAGGDGTWDRLAEYLAEAKDGKDVFVINRSFDVPQDVMFKMWTDPKHVSQWLPPTGFTMEYLRADIRTGGSSFYVMTNGKGVTMHGRAEYKEISPIHRLVYTQQFCDANEKISRHPMAPVWPETMQTVVSLEAEGADRTRVTIAWEIFGPATAEEREAFHKAKPGMTLGWTGSFDKLEDYLAR